MWNKEIKDLPDIGVIPSSEVPKFCSGQKTMVLLYADILLIVESYTLSGVAHGAICGKAIMRNLSKMEHD